MKRILFDTNIVLDVLLDRQPHVEASASVWAAVEAGGAAGMLAAHAVTTVHYLVRRETSEVRTRRILSAVLRIFGVAPVNSTVLQEALELSFPDFEDAVTAAAARSAGCEFIVTRDLKGFRGSPVRVLAAEAIVPLLR
jgi:predicted nucleic acid-binding protein